ncbi:MAG TPA: c-type cytochrome [Chloroflexota bacterium]|nr:c-type cytochrome [Chloroflexota bacterium]
MAGSATRQPHRHSRRWYLVLGIAFGFAVAVVLGLLVAAPIALTHHDAGELEKSYGSAVVGLVARIKGAGVGPNPVTTTSRTLEAGRQSYTGSCSQCHGALGDGKGVFGATSFPPATDLTSGAARDLRDGQLFYIIKNGLGFTPMPAYGSQYADQQIWELVSFIRSLQGGNAPALAVPTPTTAQLGAVEPPASGDAQRGAAVFSAAGCSGCHVPTGPLSINPANDSVAQAVRNGRPQGMPCFTPQALSDDELRDVEAFITTFPPSGFLGGPEDQPPPGAPTPPPGGTRPGNVVPGSPCAAAPGASTASAATTPGGQLPRP